MYGVVYTGMDIAWDSKQKSTSFCSIFQRSVMGISVEYPRQNPNCCCVMSYMNGKRTFKYKIQHLFKDL